MSLILAFLGSSIGKYVLGAGFALIAAVGLAFQQRLAGAKAERAKQAAEEARARDVADQVDNDVGSLRSENARIELSKWSR